MTGLRTFLSRLWAVGRSRQMDRDLDDEIASHLAEARDEYIQRGLSPEDAHWAAMRSFGGVTRSKEVYRQVASFMWLDDLARDVQYAFRTFRRSPGVAAMVVISLAVGIAAATGLFSIVHAAVLNPFPFADINRIVRLDLIDKGGPRGLRATARQLVALQHSDVFDGAFVSDTWEMTLTGRDLPETVGARYFSANALNVLGVPAPPRTSLP